MKKTIFKSLSVVILIIGISFSVDFQELSSNVHAVGDVNNGEELPDEH